MALNEDEVGKDTSFACLVNALYSGFVHLIFNVCERMRESMQI